MDKRDAKMMPGQEPYTDAERDKLDALLRGALEAEEVFSVDELELFAYERRRITRG